MNISRAMRTLALPVNRARFLTKLGQLNQKGVFEPPLGPTTVESVNSRILGGREIHTVRGPREALADAFCYGNRARVREVMETQGITVPKDKCDLFDAFLAKHTKPQGRHKKNRVALAFCRG